MNTRFLFSAALATLLCSTPASAGFTLIAPEPTGSETSIKVIPLAPTANQVPSSAMNNNLQRLQVGPPSITMQAAPAPTHPAPAPTPLLQNTVMPAPQSQSFEAPVRGFGKDMPLVLAAQQIAPAGRQIAFGQGVDPSMLISWQGGSDWRSVLGSALSDRGLTMSEQSNILFINRAGATATAPLMPTAVNLNQNYLPPSAPAPVAAAPAMVTAPQTVALPTMVMPPTEPAMAPAPNSFITNQPVIPPQQPIIAAPPAPVNMQSTAIMTEITPQAVPLAPLPDLSMTPPASVIAATPAPMMNDTNKIEMQQRNWSAAAGKTLKQTLEDWSSTANVTLRWDSEFDYPVQSNINVDGDYEAAVRTLLRGFSSAQPQPVARLYRPEKGLPGVLLVTTRGNDMSTGQ
jgi:hypothetical protein